MWTWKHREPSGTHHRNTLGLSPWIRSSLIPPCILGRTCTFLHRCKSTCTYDSWMCILLCFGRSRTNYLCAFHKFEILCRLHHSNSNRALLPCWIQYLQWAPIFVDESQQKHRHRSIGDQYYFQRDYWIEDEHALVLFSFGGWSNLMFGILPHPGLVESPIQSLTVEQPTTQYA